VEAERWREGSTGLPAETNEALQQDQSARQDRNFRSPREAKGVSAELEQARGGLGIADVSILRYPQRTYSGRDSLGMWAQDDLEKRIKRLIVSGVQ
jgi:hypothetical protein